MEREQWDRRYADTELVWGEGPNRTVEQRLADLAPGRAIDLGCGEGRNAAWLAGRGWRVTGVDFSPVALAKAARLADALEVQVDWVEADLRTYAPAERAFDLVLVAYIHLPIDLLRPLWRRAAAAVAPGGLLMILGHDLRNLAEGVGGPSDPGVLYRAGDVVAELAGLAVEEAGELVRPVGDAGGAHAIDALVLARRPVEG